VIVIVAAAIMSWRQVASVRGSNEARQQMRKQISTGSAHALFAPRTSHDRRWWIGLSLTAGICEEVLHRAFLLWYLMLWLPAAAAVPIAAVLFGLAHIYLGWGGFLRAAAFGLFFCVAYLFSGSIWLLIFLHAIIDISSGFTSSAALEDEVS
jgi:membrane protease YdiL (CAAX protease family)